MNREDTLKAVDDAFADGIKRLYEVFVEGLEIGTPAQQLGERFKHGLAFHTDSHAKTKTIVEEFFKPPGE